MVEQLRALRSAALSKNCDQYSRMLGSRFGRGWKPSIKADGGTVAERWRTMLAVTDSKTGSRRWMCRMGSASASVLKHLDPKAECGKSARCLYSVRTLDLIIVMFDDFWRLSKPTSYVFPTRSLGSTPAASTMISLFLVMFQ